MFCKVYQEFPENGIAVTGGGGGQMCTLSMSAASIRRNECIVGAVRNVFSSGGKCLFRGTDGTNPDDGDPGDGI